MRPCAFPLAGAPLGLTLLAAPPAVHLALVMHRGTALAGILVAAQATGVVWIMSPEAAPRWLRIAVSGTICLGLWLLLHSTDGGPAIAAGLPHAIIYTALLALFVRSLRPPREAVVTTLAHAVRGHLTLEIVRCTRRVTCIWCGFFAAQLLASLSLLLLAPVQVWSLFINLCNLPMIGVLLCAEFAYRRWRHASQPPERLRDMVRVLRGLRPSLVSE